jgi:hypothetical protein
MLVIYMPVETVSGGDVCANDLLRRQHKSRNVQKRRYWIFFMFCSAR